MPLRAARPGSDIANRLLHQHLTASLSSMARRDRGIRTPTSGAPLSTQPAPLQPLDQSQEDALPRVPGQHPIKQPAAAPHDLTRHLDECRTVRRELHPQQGPLLSPVLRGVPSRYGHQQGASGLQAPARRPSPCTPSCSPGGYWWPHHGHGPLGSGRMGESLLDSPPTVLEGSLLACGAFFSESGTHSKAPAPLTWNSENVFLPTLFQKFAGFRVFSEEACQADYLSRLF